MVINYKNLIKKLLVFIILTTLICITMYYLKNGVVSMESKYGNSADLIHIVSQISNNQMFIISIGLASLYIIFSWQKKILSYEETLKIKFDYIYQGCTTEQKKLVDNLSYDDKLKFTEEYLKLLSTEKNNKISEACKNKLHPKLPLTIRTTKKIILVGIISMILVNSQNMYQFMLAYYDMQSTQVEEQMLLQKEQEQLAETCQITDKDDPVTIQSKQMLIPDQTFNIEGVPPIILVCNNQASEYFINLIINKIKSQPYWLLENCTAIYIKETNTYYATGGIQDSVGTAHSPSNHIDLLYDVDFLANGNIERTIRHELGHIWDYSHGNISDSQELIALFQKYANNLDMTGVYMEYAATSNTEFFADYVSGYMASPTEMQQKAPDLYDFYQRQFQH